MEITFDELREQVSDAELREAFVRKAKEEIKSDRVPSDYISAACKAGMHKYELASRLNILEQDVGEAIKKGSVDNVSSEVLQDILNSVRKEKS